MASDIVIRAEGLGKKYVIGHQSAERVPTLRDAISRTAKNLARTTRDLLHGKPLISGDEVEEFWALKDVNFEIRRGDVVGIIGRNGAGKSTLLKVLSRITEPSEGRVEIRGRVASLLEVGTGFHPELTGRENIFLNGAILGMGREEIRRKFDEIVAFAEIERFLDTPVKRYSSGMYVRLAFAVAAHLEPEILIVDEVLAVGDAEFQKKCLGKMQDVAGEGRTVLFVSHNMSSMRALCESGMVFENGVLKSSGTIEYAIDKYSSLKSNSVHQSLLRGIRLSEIHVKDVEKGGRNNLDFSLEVDIDIESEFEDFSLILYGEGGVRLGVFDLREHLRLPRIYQKGKLKINGQVSDLRLVERQFEISLYVGCNGESADFHSLYSFRPAPPKYQSRRYLPQNLGYIDAKIENVEVRVD